MKLHSTNKHSWQWVLSQHDTKIWVVRLENKVLYLLECMGTGEILGCIMFLKTAKKEQTFLRNCLCNYLDCWYNFKELNNISKRLMPQNKHFRNITGIFINPFLPILFKTLIMGDIQIDNPPHIYTLPLLKKKESVPLLTMKGK